MNHERFLICFNWVSKTCQTKSWKISFWTSEKNGQGGEKNRLKAVFSNYPKAKTDWGVWQKNDVNSWCVFFFKPTECSKINLCMLDSSWKSNEEDVIFHVKLLLIDLDDKFLFCSAHIFFQPSKVNKPR